MKRYSLIDDGNYVDLRENPIGDWVLYDSPEMVELREKARQWDQSESMAKEFVSENIKLENVPATLTKIKEWKEKAEKWDEFQASNNFTMYHEWQVKQQERDLIMSGLVVEERCLQGHYNVEGVESREHFLSTCPDCHGTGTITRPAIAEEVREGIEIAFKFRDTDWFHDSVNHTWGLKLKSGAILRLKEDTNAA